MNKLEFFKLVKEITEASNLDELKDLVIKANNFVKENNINKGSNEFKKLVTVIDIIKFRLKKKIKSESTTPKTIVVSEEQYEYILKNLTEVDSRSQQIIDDILDQISAHGEESLSPSQLKKLEDFKDGKSVDYDKNKNRDFPPLEFESKLEGLPEIKFIFRESVETDMGFEYLGEVEFLGNVYTGFLVVDNDNKLQALEFENLETKNDLWVDAEGLEHELVSFFDAVSEGLNDEKEY